MFPRSLETDLPPPSPCALGGGGVQKAQWKWASRSNLLSPCCRGRTGCEERKCVLYSEEEPIKEAQVFSVGYTTFYRQNLCRGQCIQEQSQPQQHMWNSKLFVIFPAETTAAHSLHFQHLYVDWGYGCKTPIIKEAFCWQMIILTSQWTYQKLWLSTKYRR
jgi:hypothetical protein